MRYRPLGNTDILVSEIGFGAWGIGGYHQGAALAYGQTNDQQSMLALEQALEQGINFFDTSDLYGGGHSESLLGQTFKQKREQVVLASKAGYTGEQAQQDFSARYVEQALDQSLKRLQTDYLDLFQMHDFDGDQTELEQLLLVLENLKNKGKVRALGLSLKNARLPFETSVLARLDCVQVNFNLVDQRILENGFLELCTQHQIGVIARTPLCFGFLAGETAMDFPEGDHRARWSPEQVTTWQNALRLFITQKSDQLACSPAQFALNFCLAYPIMTCIPGMLTVEQVQENAAASDVPNFSADSLQKLNRVYQENTFFIAQK